jgi:hypothetical protein
MLAVDDSGIWIEGQKRFDPAIDCWGKSIETDVSNKEIATHAEEANYLALISQAGGIHGKTRKQLLRQKTIQDYNLFMMNHPWQKNLSDNENENKKAYENAYRNNPQHIADKQNFQEAEARIANKNSILKAVMTDPGLTLLDYENKEPDAVSLLQNSNQSFVGSRDKFFIKPQIGQNKIAPDDLRDAMVNAQGIIQSRAELQNLEPIGT